MVKARADSKLTPPPVRDDQWRIPDVLWQRIEPLLPPRPNHPLGCHNPRVDDRRAMDAIFFVLRTGCQWNALNATGICSSSSAHRRFQEWTAAGVFVTLWAEGLREYDGLKGLDWSWTAMDGAMTKLERPLPSAHTPSRDRSLWQQEPSRLLPHSRLVQERLGGEWT
jgi:transposase